MNNLKKLVQYAAFGSSLLALLSVVACGDDGKENENTAGVGGASSAGESSKGGTGAVGGPGEQAGAGGGGPTVPPLYLVPTYVLGAGDTSQTYLNVTSSFDADTVVDATGGFEIQGDAFPFVHDGVVYVTDPLAPAITKFTVDENDELVEGDKVSFAGVGLSGPPGLVHIVSNEKAYVFDVAGLRAIIWNPSDMSLTGEEIDLSDLVYQTHEPSIYTDPFSLRVRGDQIFVPVTWADVYDAGVLVLDTKNDEVVSVLRDSRCGSGTASARLGNDLYFFPSANNTLTYHNLAANPVPSCALRINADEAVFDPEYTLDLSAVTGGLGAQGGIPVGDGSLYISAIDADRFATRVSNYDPFWGFWHYELDASEATPVTGFPWWQGAMYYFEIGDRIIVPVFQGGIGDSSQWKSTFYEMAKDGTPRELFAVNASWGTIAKLR
jgi:hypothetical protein